MGSLVRKHQGGNAAFMLAALALLALILISPDAHASAGAGGGLPYEEWLSKVRSSITGPVAFTISIVAIVAAGAALIFGGDMNGFMKTLVFIVLVLAFVIAAQNTLSSLTGTGASIALHQGAPFKAFVASA